MTTSEKNQNYGNCFNENGTDYLYLAVRGLTNPYYLTNIVIFISLIALFFKNKKMINIMNPFLITNGLFISVYCLLYLKEFDLESLKYICPREYKDKSSHNKLLEVTNQPNFINFYKYSQPLVHFWLPVLFYYLGYSKNPNKHTNIIESLIVTYLIMFIYGTFINNDRYGFVIKNNTLFRDFCIYIFLHLIITIIYFNF